MLKTAAEMMKAMPPEQLKAAMAQAGQHLPPGMDIDPQQLSQMAETVAKMPPEQVCGKSTPQTAPDFRKASGMCRSTDSLVPDPCFLYVT